MIVLYILAGIVGLLILHVAFLFILAAFTRNKDYDKLNRFYRSVYLFHCRLLKFFCNIRIKTTGREKLDAINGRFLLVGNHRSDFDPFVTVLGLKLKDLAFISKPENFRIPFFGKIVRRCFYTAIDRENARNALKTINRTAGLIKDGAVSFGVYPEGTRSKSTSMLPFHDGVFKIAQKAGAPVVVVALRGTERVHKRAPFLKTVVYLDVIDVIDAERVRELSSHELSALVREELYSATEGK